MLTVVDSDGLTPDGSLIDEIVREGARRMLAAALEAEVNGCLAELAEQRDAAGRRLVVRNGFHAERTMRCRVHKTANVLDALPKSAQSAAKNAIADIYNAEDKDQAAKAIRAFAKQYSAKFPRAERGLLVECDGTAAA